MSWQVVTSSLSPASFTQAVVWYWLLFNDYMGLLRTNNNA